jgi:putative cardiolipin synthase
MITGGRNIENTYFDHSTVMNFRDRDVLACRAGRPRRGGRRSSSFWALPARGAEPRAGKDVAGTHRPRRAPALRGRAPTTTSAASSPALDARGGRSRRCHRRASPAACGRWRRPSSSADAARQGAWASSHGRAAHHSRPAPHAGRRASERRDADALPGAEPPGARAVPRAAGEESRPAHPHLVKQLSPPPTTCSPTRRITGCAGSAIRGRPGPAGARVQAAAGGPACALPAIPADGGLGGRTPKPGRASACPFLCLHAKSLVVDDRLAFVGSYNLDPRSENLNTEVGLLVEDAAFARPSCWPTWRGIMRPRTAGSSPGATSPSSLDALNGLIDGILSLSPIDVWPIQNTSSFELRPGAAEVPPATPGLPSPLPRGRTRFPAPRGCSSQKEI